jgi:acyl carrier protein
MNKEDLLKRVNEIFIEMLDDEDIELNYDTTAADVDGWDSLFHIQLIVGVEKEFKIKFTSLEIQSFKNIGDFCDKILSKL